MDDLVWCLRHKRMEFYGRALHQTMVVEAAAMVKHAA